MGFVPKMHYPTGSVNFLGSLLVGKNKLRLETGTFHSKRPEKHEDHLPDLQQLQMRVKLSIKSIQIDHEWDREGMDRFNERCLQNEMQKKTDNRQIASALIVTLNFFVLYFIYKYLNIKQVWYCTDL